MPNPGQANNGLGINSFSGPMGQKEPAYGEIERLKNLTAMAPIGSPAALGAPKRAKRAAVRGSSAAPTPAAPTAAAAAPPPPEIQHDSYEVQMRTFWQQLAADPDASPLVRQYAQEVLGG